MLSEYPRSGLIREGLGPRHRLGRLHQGDPGAFRKMFEQRRQRGPSRLAAVDRPPHGPAERRDVHLSDLVEGGLSGRVERAHGLHFIAEELHAHGQLGRIRKYVEDAAPAAELTRQLDLAHLAEGSVHQP